MIVNSEYFEYLNWSNNRQGITSGNDDEKIMEKHVKENPYNFSYASDRLKNDKAFVTTGIQQEPYVLQFAGEKLHKDKEFILSLVKINGLCLRFVKKEFKDDKDIVLAAVSHPYLVLPEASPRMKKDKDIVHTAVKYWAQSVEVIHDSFVHDRDQFAELVKINPEAILNVSSNIWPRPPLYMFEDKELVMMAVYRKPEILKELYDIGKDPDVISASTMKGLHYKQKIKMLHRNKKIEKGSPLKQKMKIVYSKRIYV
jgi:hypothetical protein